MPGTVKSPGGTDRRARLTAIQDHAGRHYRPPACKRSFDDVRRPSGPPVTSLEAFRSILTRSRQGSVGGDGLAVCKALQLIAFVAEGRGDRGSS